MENASKALLIAASVLVAIILITIGIKVYTSTSGTQKVALDTGDTISRKTQDATGLAVSQIAGEDAAWDINAVPEDCFIWSSDDPNTADYGVITGYNEKIQNYKTIKFPKRTVSISCEIEGYGQIKNSYIRNVEKIAIPSSTTIIGAYSFSDCSKLTSIKIGENVTDIQNGAFEDCEKLNSFIIPNSVKKIRFAAFARTGITSIVIPGSVILEDDGAIFSGCSNLVSVKFKNNIDSIPSSMFEGCTNLKNVIISNPNNIKSIDNEAFRGCSSLESIELGNSLISIGDRAFGNCTNIKKIVFPNSVQSIGTYAFDNWTSNQYIYFRGSSVPNSNVWKRGCHARITYNYSGN